MKKNYNQPIVETTQMTMGSVVMVGSPTDLPIVSTPIPGEGD